MTRSLRSTTVGQLIAILQDEDPEALVAFASDYGDISHTMQVHAIRGELEEVRIEPSAYSDSGWALRDEEEEDGSDAARPSILIVK